GAMALLQGTGSAAAGVRRRGGGVEVGESRVHAHAAVDVDRFDAEADAAVEVVEVVRALQAEGDGRFETGAVERAALVLVVGTNAEPPERTGEQRRKASALQRSSPAILAQPS